MTGEEVYRAPDLSPDQVTAVLVRDELVRCFESANGELLRRAGQQVPKEELKKMVFQFVTNVFQSCGASYENPTKEGILKAIENCKQTAESQWGKSDVIEHHYHEMMKLVNKLD